MMKKTIYAAALAACLGLTAAAQTQPAPPAAGQAHEHGKEHGHEHGQERATPPAEAANVTLAPGEVLKRGEALGDAPAVAFADALKTPEKYAGKPVVVEGVVERVCQMQGCWMELAPAKGERGVRVQMKGHAFFVPFNAAGLRARAAGTFSVKTLTKEDADHYEGEGAKLNRNPDGTATEISFVAAGVELRK
jgi:hypothetical protein